MIYFWPTNLWWLEIENWSCMIKNILPTNAWRLHIVLFVGANKMQQLDCFSCYKIENTQLQFKLEPSVQKLIPESSFMFSVYGE